MKILNYTVLCSLFMLINLQGFSQNKSSIRGKIVDGETNEPIAFAQVALYERGDESKPVAGTTSQTNGQFDLPAQAGNYDLAVVFVGYKKKTIVGIQINSGNKNLGELTLTPATTQLEEVVVKSEEPSRPISTDIEGMTVNPDQTLSNAGGSLLDVLRNVPSISVSQDGTISIRGSSSTNVLIDGRNSVLATDLEQLPASAIENIKIINNPNAKYDAEGTGGVINIQLKKGENTGTSGQAEVTLGTRGRFNSNLRLSKRTEKYNIYGGYSYRSWPRIGNGMTIRETFDNNERLTQNSNTERNDSEHTFNFGGDVFFGRNKFSYEGAVNFEDERDEEIRSTKVTDLDDNDDLLLQYARENIETEDNLSLDNAIFYERLFDDSDKELRALVSHSFRDQLEKQNINSFSGVLKPEEGEITGKERSLNDEFRKTTIIQFDYMQPLWNGKLETGYKSTFRSFDNDYTYEVLNNEEWVNQENVSNRFLYQDQIHAAYIIHTRSIGKFDLSAGIRAEQTLVDTKLYNTEETNEQSYLNFFPSFQALYNLDDNNGLKLTYSRRIDRPNGWRLNPFPDIADSLNIRQGNPDLQPEMIHSLELGHLVTFKNADLTTNLFFRHVDGQVDYIVDVVDGISYRMPANLNTKKTYGAEIIGSATIFPWWNANASYSIFQSEVDGSNLGAEFTNKGISWNAKLTTDFTIPYDIGLQLTGNYDAPEIEAQGRDFARYYLDASLQKSILNDRGNINLTLRDIFNTRNFSGENYSSEFYQEFEWKRESRIFLASFSYKI